MQISGKNRLLRNLLLFLLLVAGSGLCSCDRFGLSVGGGDVQSDNALYAVAVVFPDGYDWRRDSLGGRVKTTLRVFRNASPIMDVSLSKERLIAQDASSQRLYKGHLYVNFNEGVDIVFQKDTLEVLRFAGGETVYDMYVSDTCIYSLGEYDGGGWIYRKNGRVIHSEQDGTTLGGFYEDEGRVHFAYRVPLSKKSGDARFFCVDEERVSQIIPYEDISDIYAVRKHLGEMNLLAKSRTASGILWQRGDKTVMLEDATDIGRAFSLVRAGGRLYAHETVFRGIRMDFLKTGSSKVWNDTFWDEEGAVFFNTGGQDQVFSFCDGAPYFCCALSPDGISSLLTIHADGKVISLPARYRMLSPESFCCNRRNWAAGLNDSEDNFRPLVISGIDTTAYGFNGYFTRLELP